MVVMVLVAKCLTLCDPMDCNPPGSSAHGDSPGKNTGVGCHFLLQGSFPTQESKLGHLHCKQMLYHLSYWGSPSISLSYRDSLIKWGEHGLEIRQDKDQTLVLPPYSCAQLGNISEPQFPNLQNVDLHVKYVAQANFFQVLVTAD